MKALSGKKKPCKAKGCRKWFHPSRPFETWCSPDCGFKISQQKLEEKKKKADKEFKTKVLENDKRWHMKKAVATYNRWIVKVRDVNEPCISSGRTQAVQWQCGHYVPGTCANLRFDEANTHKQSSEDNLYRSGNLIEYRVNLIKKIGIKEVERLEGPQPQKKFTIEELKEIRAEYAKRLKDAGIPAP